MRKFKYIITKEYDNMILKDYLKNIHNYSNRLITKIKNDKSSIKRNNQHIRMIDYVYSNDIIQIVLQDECTIKPNFNLKSDIVYDDDDIIIFNKPPFMPIHQSQKHYDDTLANVFANYCNKNNLSIPFRPINRLDKNTSGLCLIAKNQLACNINKTIKKTYYAIVTGKISPVIGIINLPIDRKENSIIKRCVSKNGQKAITHYKLIKTMNNNSLLEIILETGRTHQIRVHFSHIGHPLLGDDLYGGCLNNMNRQALHCGKLKFIHPIKNIEITIKCPLPNDMTNLLF